MELVFPSRVDLWLVAVMVGGALICALPLPAAFRRSMAAGVLLLVSTAGLAVGTWMVLDTEYVVSDDAVTAHLGPFTDPLFDPRAVVGVEPSRDSRGAPASSLDRLAISLSRETGGGVVLVSPDDRVGFLDALAARSSGLVRDGERLVRGR